MMIRNELRAFLFLIPVITLTMFGDISFGEEPEVGKPLQWPAFLKGSVVTDDSQPIDDATVSFSLHKMNDDRPDRWSEAVYSSQVQTNEQGVYRISSADLPLRTHHTFLIKIDVAVDGYADGRKFIWYRPENNIAPEQNNIAKIKLVPGRLVVGRCVDPSGTPVVGAVVTTSSGHFMNQPRVDVGWDPVVTDEAGRFFLRVPDDGKVTINSWISHPDWAPQHVEVPLDTNLFRKKIKLKKGGILSGTVRTIDGKPAAGIVIAASSTFSGTVKGRGFSMNIAVKTDANGRYQLPPFDGAYRVFLGQSERNNNSDGDQFVVGDQSPPLVVPQLVTLKAGDNQILNFVEQPKITVSGRVSWSNGEPVSRHKIQPYYMPTEFRTGIFLIKTVTDDDGNYSIEIPIDMPELGIMVLQAKDANGKWHWAHPAEYVVAPRKQTQMTTIDIHGKNLVDIDWIMREEY